MTVDAVADRIEELNRSRLYRTIGLVITDAGRGLATSRLEPPPELCYPHPDQPHGGIVFTQLDTTMAAAVITTLTPGQHCATIGVDIQYARPAEGAYFVCSASTTHRTGRTRFLRAETRSPAGDLIALGQGTFRVFESRSPPAPASDCGEAS